MSEEAQAKPHRRITMKATIEADSWDDLYGHMRNLVTQMAMSPDHSLSKTSVSGGYSSGHIIEIAEDESMDHDKWAAAIETHVEGLRP